MDFGTRIFKDYNTSVQFAFAELFIKKPTWCSCDSYSFVVIFSSIFQCSMVCKWILSSIILIKNWQKRDICLIMSQRVSLLCILQLVFPGVPQCCPHFDIRVIPTLLFNTCPILLYESTCVLPHRLLRPQHLLCRCGCFVKSQHYSHCFNTSVTSVSDCISICLVNALSLDWEELSPNSKLCLLCVFRE